MQFDDNSMLSAEEIVSARRIVNGPKDGLRALNPVKYGWAKVLWDKMRKNDWGPNEVNLITDKQQYKTLTKGERTTYDRSLAFLSNLDSIQVENLVDHISDKITAPEIKRCIHRQIFEEEIHVESYSRMVEMCKDDPMEIYGMYATNPILGNKNVHITKQAELLDEGDFSDEKFLYAVDSNIALEGIYFFSGFLSFYALARRGKMLGSADMIKYIQRDELTHLELFLAMRKEMRAENPWLFSGENGARIAQNCTDLINDAVNLEIAWGKHVIEDGILGITPEIVEGFIRHLGDARLTSMGLPRIYNVKNPVDWFYSFSAVNKSEANFFERRPVDYKSSKSGGLQW